MAGISPSYRIGPSDFFTSDDLRADGNTLNDQVNRLRDKFYSGSKVSDDLWNAWADFVDQWRTFYSGLGFFSAWNDSNRDQLVQFETRFQGFVTDYERQTNSEVPDVVQVSSGAQDTLGQQLRNQLQPLIPSVNMTYVLVALVIGAAIFFVGRHYFRNKGVPL